MHIVKRHTSFKNKTISPLPHVPSPNSIQQRLLSSEKEVALTLLANLTDQISSSEFSQLLSPPVLTELLVLLEQEPYQLAATYALTNVTVVAQSKGVEQTLLASLFSEGLMDRLVAILSSGDPRAYSAVLQMGETLLETGGQEESIRESALIDQVMTILRDRDDQ